MLAGLVAVAGAFLVQLDGPLEIVDVELLVLRLQATADAHRGPRCPAPHGPGHWARDACPPQALRTRRPEGLKLG